MVGENADEAVGAPRFGCPAPDGGVPAARMVKLGEIPRLQPGRYFLGLSGR